MAGETHSVAPPGRRPLTELLEDCVHCGFCLPACPTYVLWGEEMDSPRGRIHLIGQATRGAPLAGALAEHLDRCLSCMGCMTACPSGVRYDELIETARARVEAEVARPWRERATRSAIFGLFPYPRRLRVARAGLAFAERSGLRRLTGHRAVARRMPPVLRAMEALSPPVTEIEPLPARLAAEGERRGTVAMLTGCVQRVFFSGVNAATQRVLAAEGFDVVVPTGQGCCGALSGHSGRHEEAARFARATIAAFEQSGATAVVVNAAGCGSAMKEYGRLLADDPAFAERAARFSARTSATWPSFSPRRGRAPGATHCRWPSPTTTPATSPTPRASAPSRGRLLRAIPGLELREVPDGDLCCGSAGVYNLLQPEPAAELGERKARNVLATGAEVLVTANPGCLMQIRAAAARLGSELATAHLAEVIDASIGGRPVPGVGTRHP